MDGPVKLSISYARGFPNTESVIRSLPWVLDGMLIREVEGAVLPHDGL